MPTRKLQPLKLLKAAAACARKAHAPYSRFHVGAALLTNDGEIIAGCNVENASYGLTICAERNAIFASVARGKRKFAAVAIVADAQLPYPCGACRQVLAEFCPPSTPVFIAPIRNLRRHIRTTLGELLPMTFRLKA